MSGQNILTGSKLCWEATFRQGRCRLCPDAILRPDKIFSMDESELTFYSFNDSCPFVRGPKKICLFAACHLFIQ